MTLEYKSIVPWGRSFKEYQAMFSLSDADLKSKILGCGDGPASFNAEMTRMGHKVVSCDPVYAFSKEQIQKRIDETFDEVMAQTRGNQDKFIWDHVQSLENLGKIRMQAMAVFLEDFEAGLAEGRYIDAELPSLPLEKGAFDLALCSHFLFLYSDHLSLAFHLESILEMLRLARDVRIFPVLDYNAKQSIHLKPLMESLEKKQINAQLEKVDYLFQRGGDHMLRVTR